ncbi:MAG: hypothetical protein HZA54_08790 [Planctomycetes bacterium]|nr:hypothetical protein [Planctomycetota bacterium]
MKPRPFFKVPLNLSHAATVAGRIVYHLDRVSGSRPPGDSDPRADLGARCTDLRRLLEPYVGAELLPPAEEAQRVANDAVAVARALVDGIERHGVGDDRLGQAVRNLFECLGYGAEGATQSLRAGENPDSLLRPI